MTYLSNIIDEFNEFSEYLNTIMPSKEPKQLKEKMKCALREAYESGEQGLPYPRHYEPRGVQQH
jgi:hypothetical protein